MDSITAALKNHYSETFAEHGATARGVDWGEDADVVLRYDKMLAVLDSREALKGGSDSTLSVLDVGCGYGGLYQHATSRGLQLDYTGIDVVPEMIAHAQVSLPQGRFVCRDVFDGEANDRYDYVICNGILTQKLTTSIREMDSYAQEMIRRLFQLCRCGVAFNLMTNKVNFTVDNLYYRSPVEILAFCFADITDKVKLDHSYRLHDYTVYLYR
ncbi:MAG: class I SAM-dependent methyltransferase [Chthoniobacterales bacterium]|nr:class I SAM-dependent methyltransferase [Chthoniobacterales bacterium]